ncbi:hypothetical protein Tco_0751578 [Tanacetum coccineum]|uniref:Reverse transcriptase Ty1/copia-type domain-containing protein n=1 Tax=Tanacetum coccineum TaxID=301880 RepID=A0ABQ4Z595_9ASTR
MVWMMWSPSSTPMATERLDVDLQGTPTDQTTYRRMIGGLMYLTASRPDIAFANFIQSYNMGLWYSKDSGFKLIAYSDSDHAGCKDDCKSTSGGLQFLGGTVHWMRAQLLDCGYKYNRILMYCDSKSAIAISCNPVQHSKTKHIDIRYHFIKEHVEKGTVELYFVGTEYQLADLFTKALLKERFEYLVHRIGRYKDKVRMQIPEWMISEEMKNTKHYQIKVSARKSFVTLVDHLQEVMVELLPTMVDTHIKEQVKRQVPEQVQDQVLVYVAEGVILERQKTKEEMKRMIAKAILQERGNIHAEISSQIQKAIDNHIPSQVDTSVRSYMSGHILHVHPVQSQTTFVPEQQYQLDQDDPHDDALLEGENSAKWQKTYEYEAYVSGESSSGQVNEKERVPSTSDLLYLKKGRPEKIVLSLHKFLAIIFNDDDIEEQTSPDLDGKQKEPGKPKEVIYSNSKIIQVIKTYWELGHEHKFITEIVARRANECIVSITEPNYKNLNKNDIEDMFMLIINGKVPNYVETGLLWSLSVFIRSSVI